MFFLRRLDNLADGFTEGDCDIPIGIVTAHFGKVGDVTDVVADPVFILILEDLGLASDAFGDGEGFEDGAGVGAASADVVDFGDAGRVDEGGDELGDVVGVDVVSYLLAIVAEDFVFPAFEIALHKVGQKAMQLDSTVIRAGEAAAAQAAGGHAEIPAVFLDHDIGRDFGSPEEGVLGLVDGKVFGDAIGIGGVGVVPAGVQLGQSNGIRPVTIDLIGGHVDEGGFRAGLAGGFEEIQGSNGIGVKVVKRDRGGAVVRGLGGGVDDGIGPQGLQQGEHAGTVADVELVVSEGFPKRFGEPALVPSGIALRAEEDGALVVVDPVDGPAEFCKVHADFGADEAGGAGDEERRHGEGGEDLRAET